VGIIIIGYLTSRDDIADKMPTVTLYNNRALTFQTLAKEIIFDHVALFMKERMFH
jgi:hypothetical protein